MDTKCCSRCNEIKPLEGFRKGRSVCRSCYNKLANDRKLEAKQYVWDLLVNSSGCVDCGERNPILLDFDHLVPEIKTNNISSMLSRGYSLDKIKLEISKCVIKCCSCHRKHTVIQQGWYRNIDTNGWEYK